MPNTVKDVEFSENSHNASGNKNGKPLWELGYQFLINIYIYTALYFLMFIQEKW